MLDESGDAVCEGADGVDGDANFVEALEREGDWWNYAGAGE
jgi:hypothetical protein